MLKLAATGAVTVKVTVVVSAVPLAGVPVIVIVYVPVVALEPTEIDIVELPVPVIDVGLKPMVTPVDGPDTEADKVTGELNPPTTVLVIVDDPALPCTTETALGEAERLNPGCATVPASVFSRVVPFGLPQPVTKSYPVAAA